MKRISLLSFVLCLLSVPCPLSAAAREPAPSILLDESYGALLESSSDTLALWWASSGWKVSRERGLPEEKASSISLELARNEWEATQLVLRPHKAMSGLHLSATDLQSASGARIPADCIELLRVRYLAVEKASDGFGCEGFWPDPLPPLENSFDLEAEINQPIWIRVYVPGGSEAGTYEGALLLEGEGTSVRIPLQLRVYGFTLPDRSSCTSAFGFSPAWVYQYHGLDKQEDRKAVLDLYWESFRKHRISPYTPAPEVAPEVNWVPLERDACQHVSDEDAQLLTEHPLTPVFDWSAWDQEMDRVFKTFHFNSFRFGVPGIAAESYQGFPEGSRGYDLAFNAWGAAVESHLRETGRLNDAYIYWVDEPTENDYPQVMKGFNQLKKALPGMRRMLTEQVEPELAGGPDIWCPLLSLYNHERAEERRAAGDSFWWYICTGPKQPFLGLFIDHPGTDLRAWLWLTWKYGIEGILIWHTNWWTSNTAYPDQMQNPYKDPMSWQTGYGAKTGDKKPWGNGDGRFLYPPERAAGGQPEQPVLEGPVDSIRWELLRDGVEDYEYFVILRRLLAQKSDNLDEKERQLFNELLLVPEKVASGPKEYTKDPAPLERQRHRLGRAIERLQALESK